MHAGGRCIPLLLRSCLACRATWEFQFPGFCLINQPSREPHPSISPIHPPDRHTPPPTPLPSLFKGRPGKKETRENPPLSIPTPFTDYKRKRSERGDGPKKNMRLAAATSALVNPVSRALAPRRPAAAAAARAISSAALLARGIVPQAGSVPNPGAAAVTRAAACPSSSSRIATSITTAPATTTTRRNMATDNANGGPAAGLRMSMSLPPPSL